MQNDKKINVAVDVLEEEIRNYYPLLLDLLLRDKTTHKNIIWATDDYSPKGEGYSFNDEITAPKITGKNARLIQPRITKTKQNQVLRTKDKAEVFTPSWVCNKQNNLVDEQWFGRKGVFNEDNGNSWTSTKGKIVFATEGKNTWKRYVDAQRLEMACGEAPYLVSRYDTVTGDVIPINERIGLLDRKLRVINENTVTESEWLLWANRAFESTYAFEYQGDSLLLARENLFATFIDYYETRFGKMPAIEDLKHIALIISWNVWQMDALKAVVPKSCHSETEEIITLFGTKSIVHECPGCKTGDIKKHTGTYCKIQDWRTKKPITFLSMLKEE